ncbi:MAG: hypothetical protein ABF322_01350, partial [Lentimonas sp.]
EAEQAALLSLNIAIGELQKAAGPDQRVTAAAEVRADSLDGNQHWVGIWDTSEVDRFDTEGTRDAGFLRWLVSTRDSQDPSQLDFVASVIPVDGINGLTVFEAEDAAGVVDTEDSVHATLVPIDDTGSYAFWVEDEGVKAKVSYTEDADRSNNLSTEALQRSRLSATPGIDFTQLEGLMSGVTDFKYPIAHSDNDDWRNDISKLTSSDQIQLMDSTLDTSWLDVVRHDATLYSKGLLTNVRDGGLRKDLSLAFEMDDDKDEPNDLDNFNASDFVGSGSRSAVDVTSAVNRAPGQTYFSRYAYAETVSDPGIDGIIRGPTWYNIRDYYNLYKRVSVSGSTSELDVRAMYPNRSEVPGTRDTFIGSHFYPHMGKSTMRQPAIQEVTGSNRYMFRRSKGAYAPVMLGYRFVFNLYGYDYDTVADTAKLGISFDPWFYLWNPYDKQITVENYKIRAANGIAVSLGFSVDGNSYSEERLSDYLSANDSSSTGSGRSMFFLSGANGDDIVMEPGQVLVFSSGDAGSITTSLRLNLYPGTNTLSNSGIILKRHPSAGEVVINNVSTALIDTTINVNGGHASLATSFVEDVDLPAAKISDLSINEEESMMLYVHTGSGNPLDSAGTQFTVEDSSAIDLFALGNSGRLPIGYYDDVFKSALGDEASLLPVGMFSHFNPTAATTNNMFWKKAPPNRSLGGYESSGSISAAFPDNTNGVAYWGKSYKSGSGKSNVPLREIPTGPLLSLASLRHGDFSTFFFEPMNLFGSSYSSPWVDPETYISRRSDTRQLYMYDSAWLFNDGVWDSYFFSGIAPEFSYTGGSYTEESGASLESSISKFLSSDPDSTHGNARYLAHLGGETSSVLATELGAADGYEKLARNIIVDGSFNVNSTSPKAWAALLGANRGLEMAAHGNGDGDVSADDDVIPFPKTLSPISDNSDPWTGYPGISDADLLTLADDIVEQVKLRGPFMSLADFVNRRLSSTATGQSGAIQAAIDSSNVNSTVESSEGGTADYSNAFFLNNTPGGSNTAAKIGGQLTQADILQPIAPVLSARSDTFRIRSYGERKDPVSGKVVARATCEVVVQRMPEYVDATDVPETALAGLNSTNLQFGRRFEVISFKWLSDDA